MNYKTLAYAVLLTLGSLTSAMAQDLPASQTTQASKNETESTPIIKLDDLVITASRYLRSISTTPASITVVTREEIENNGYQTVPDILRSVPGISVRDESANGRTASIDIRGWGETAAANSLILLDGQRLNNLDMSGVEFSIIPPNRIERIEVLRGGGGVLYGDYAVGGVVNIITKKPEQGHHATSESYVGSYDTFKQSFSFNGAVDGWYYDASVSYLETDGYRDNNHLRTKVVGFTVGYDDGGDYFFDLKSGYKIDQFGLPGYTNSEDHLTDSSSPDDFGRTDFSYMLLTPGVRFNDEHQFTFGLGWKKSNNFAKYFYLDYFTGLPTNSDSKLDLEEWSLSPKYEGLYTWGEVEHQVIVGSDIYYGRYDQNGTYATSDASRLDVGVYANDTIKLTDQLYLDFGYRYSHIDVNYTPYDDNSDDIHSWRFGITKNYAPNSKYFYSVDRSFRTQRLDELGSSFGGRVPIDEVQETTTHQLGIQHVFNEKIMAGATLFLIDTDNEIFYNPVSFQNTTYKETTRRGFELFTEYRPLENLTFRGSFTYTDAKMGDGDYDNETVPLVPKYALHLNACYTLLDQITFSGTIHWAKGAYLGSDWANAYDSWLGENYWTTDLRVSWHPVQWFEIYTGVNNLFDEEYATSGYYTPNKIYPAPGVNVYMGIRLSVNF